MSGWFYFALEHILSFGIGVIVGFLLSNRFKLIRRNGNDVQE